jgi:membrane-associated protein
MDVYLAQLVETMGGWVYFILFLVIFCETGLVIAPWLPGESLLIASGTLAGGGILSIFILGPLIYAAAFLGDLCNYLIGRFVGRHILSKPRRLIRPEHVAQAHEFYEKHGGMAIVLARFMPVVRTLAPFVAGAAKMELHRFVFFDAVASLLWVTIFLGAGYWFGTVPWVRDNLALVLLGVVLASILPSIITFIVKGARAKRGS